MVGKDPDRKIWMASTAMALVIASVALLIANLGYFDPGGSGAPLGPAAYQISEVMAYSAFVIILVLLVLVIVRFVRRQAAAKQREQSEEGGIHPIIALLVILGAVILFIMLTGGRIVPPPDDPGGNITQGTTPDPLIKPDGQANTLAILGMLIGLAILTLVLGSRHVRRRPVRVSIARYRLERREAKAAVDEALRQLHAGDDPRSVVIRTYQMMSRLMRGKVEAPGHLTPRELAVLAQDRLGWPGSPTQELTTLFEEAWYSQHRMGEESRERALRCLSEISAVAGTEVRTDAAAART